MDAELARLARAVEADPADVDTARRYDAALRRAGRLEDVEERFLAKYVCPLAWEAMGPQARDQRRCELCAADVFETGWDHQPEAAELIAEGRSLVVGAEAAALNGLLELLMDAPQLHTARDDSRPRFRLHVSAPSYASYVTEAQRGWAAPLLEAAGAWVVPFDLTRCFYEEDLPAALTRTFRRLLVVARRLCPPDRPRPLLVCLALLGHLRPAPPAPPALLGWIGAGEGGALFVDREGNFLNMSDSTESREYLRDFLSTLP